MSNEGLPTRNPRTGLIDHQMPVCSPAEVAATAAALRGAQPAWRARGVAERVAVLQRWAQALRAERDGWLAALRTDTGRQAEAVLEFYATLGALERWCA